MTHKQTHSFLHLILSHTAFEVDFTMFSICSHPIRLHQPISNCNKRQSGNEACSDIACEGGDVAAMEQLYAFVGEG